MFDDKSKSGARDRPHTPSSEDCDVKDCASKDGISAEQMAADVKAVGSITIAVEAYWKQNRQG